jgi:hypothetical protein
MTQSSEDGEDDSPEAGLAADVALKRTLEKRRKQVSAIEAELERRANGGVPSERARTEWTRTEWTYAIRICSLHKQARTQLTD